MRISDWSSDVCSSDLWNIYAFHGSDGENWPSDNEEARKAAQELCEVANLFGYGEIKPHDSFGAQHSLLQVFRSVDADNFKAVEITGREDVWPSLKALLSRERQPTAAAS